MRQPDVAEPIRRHNDRVGRERGTDAGGPLRKRRGGKLLRKRHNAAGTGACAAVTPCAAHGRGRRSRGQASHRTCRACVVRYASEGALKHLARAALRRSAAIQPARRRRVGRMGYGECKGSHHSVAFTQVELRSDRVVRASSHTVVYMSSAAHKSHISI